MLQMAVSILETTIYNNTKRLPRRGKRPEKPNAPSISQMETAQRNNRRFPTHWQDRGSLLKHSKNIRP
jgi:hypothetical protein